MKLAKRVALATAMACACIAHQPLAAQNKTSRETDGIISNCFGAPADADKAVVRDVCLRAFDGAIVQAQRNSVHSPQMLNLYWVQASRAAGILVVLFVEEDQGFERRACTTAYRGWQSWNQADADFKQRAGLSVSQALQPSISHCKSHWDRGEWQ